MRFSKMAILGRATGLLLLCAGCSGDQRIIELDWRVAQRPGRFPEDDNLSPADRPCERDDDCRSGFCDRGKCGDLAADHNYGRECREPPFLPQGPPPPTVPGEGSMRQGWEYACGAYLCLDGRCRSCTSDADCRVRQRVVTKEDTETTCEHIPDFPGKTCGRYDLARREGRLPALPPPGPYLTPAQTQVQPNSSVADGGIQDKLPHGTACVRDRDCRSGFCDAGICVHLYGKGNYGRDCEPLPPVVAPEPGADGPMPAEIIGRALREDGCGGYLCIDRRCRSCAQDSECRDALGSPACVEVAEYLGRSCAGLFHPPRSGGGPPPLLAPGPPR